MKNNYFKMKLTEPKIIREKRGNILIHLWEINYRASTNRPLKGKKGRKGGKKRKKEGRKLMLNE